MVQAQPDAYGLSATSASSKWLTVSPTAGLGALQNLPVAVGATRYNGQVAQRSQMVRRDDQGNILFFGVDGRIYDGQGYLIADAKGPGCVQCVDPGVAEMISIPVPGSCTMFFLLSSVAQTVSNPAYVQYSVLDMAAPNSYHAGRTGGLLEIFGSAFNSAFPTWSTTTEASFFVGSLPVSAFLAKGNSPIIRAVKSGTASTAHVWLYLALTDHLFTYKITAGGIDPVEPISGQFHVPLNNTASPATTKQFVRDADVFRNGSTIHFAMVDDRIYKPYPSYATLGDLITMRFNNTTGALISGSVAVYTVGVTGGSSNPANGAGGLSGCVFGTTATTIWVSGNYWTGSTWVPRIGTLNTTTGVLTDRSSLIPSLGNYVNSRMYRNIAPLSSQGQAIYFPTSTTVGVLTGIANPGTATFNASGIAAPAPIASIPGNPNIYFPPFLNEGIMGENFVPHFASTECCVERQNLGAVNGFTVSTNNTPSAPWQPGSHPFGGGSTIIFSQDLVVPAGRRLYLKDLTLRFAENAKLVVQQGGYVHTRNTRLTGYDCANARWQGVRILGTYTMPQTTDIFPVNQGRMELRESSIVENAVVGAQLGADVTIPFYILASGGILNTDNSTFRNCQESVRVHPYQNTQVGNPGVLLANRTSFRTTTFTVDANYPAPYDFKHHAYLNLVSGIIFSGSHFNNARADALFAGMGSLQLGYGIRSLDAEFKVVPACGAVVIGACPPQFLLPSSFTGLDHGVNATVATTSRAFEVDRTNFTDNICGVYAVGIPGLKATNNNFTLGGRNVTLNNPVETSWLNHRRGVYTYESSGFAIDYNTLSRTQGSTQLTEGIVVGKSGSNNDYVFHNSATNLNIGFVGEGVCASLAPSQTPEIGLQFLCNSNSNTGINLWSRKITTAGDQASHTIRANQGKEYHPADNLFDNWNNSANLSQNKWDFRVTTTLSPINYWHRNSSGSYVPMNTPSVPSQHLMNPYQVTSIPNNNCSSKVHNPPQQQEGLIAAIEEEKEAHETLRYLHDGLIDQGNTEHVVNEINSSWPQDAWVLRTSMLARSPFLSTEALTELVLHNTLPHALLAEVLIANPEGTKGEGFYTWLENEAPNPLPAYLLQQIRSSWHEHTYRAQLEWQMADHHAALTQLILLSLQQYQSDTLYEHVDSVRITWGRMPTVNGRYAEALTLIQQERFSEAGAAIATMANDHKLVAAEVVEMERALQYLSYVEGVLGIGGNMAGLSDVEIGQLIALRDGAYDRPGTWANNILCFHHDICLPLPSGGEEDGAKSMMPPVENDEVASSVMRIFPNPSTTWSVIDLDLAEPVVNAYIRILDATGRQVQRVNVATAGTQLVLDTRGLSPGLYLVELFNDTKRLHCGQLIIQP